jgi:hypothetical protein
MSWGAARCAKPANPWWGLQLAPQQRRRIRHDKPCRLQGVLGVVVVTQLAGQIDELLHRGGCGSGGLAAQASLRVGDQTLERQSPARAFSWRHAPVTGHVGTRAGECNKLAHLAQQLVWSSGLLGAALATIMLV